MTPSHLPVPESDLWLSLGGEAFLGGTRLALLRQIRETGSITKAGKAVGISYRTAWDAIDALNALSEKPLVESTAGGKKGGGTRLTDHGLGLLDMYAAYRNEHDRFLESLRRNVRDFDRFRTLARRLSLKVSARNQLWGKVESVRAGALRARVTLRLNAREKLHAEITRAGLDALALGVGDIAYALLKANWITLSEKPARSKTADVNCIKGNLAAMSYGGKTAMEASLKTRGGIILTVSATDESVPGMRLQPGREAYAVFRAADVILGVPA